MEDARIGLSQTTLKTAFEASPLVPGSDPFARVYATVERKMTPLNCICEPGHNDAAELLLETGIRGAGLLLAFLVWYSRRTYRAWTAPQAQDGSSIEVMLDRAASLIIGLLLLHSLVDYPLRTTALGTVFSFFSAVLAVAAITSPHSKREREAHWPEKQPKARASL